MFCTLHVTFASEIDKFSIIFQDGLRCCSKVKVSLRGKENMKPIFKLKCPVKYGTLAMVGKELNYLLQVGENQPVNFS